MCWSGWNGRLAAFMRVRARNWKAPQREVGEGGGRAAVIDKRKTVSEGNPIGGRQRRDVQASLVRLRAMGRGFQFLEGSYGGVRMPGCIPGNDYRKTTGSFDGRNPAWRTWQPHRLNSPPPPSLAPSPPPWTTSPAGRRLGCYYRGHCDCSSLNRPGSGFRSICPGEHFRNRKFDRTINCSVGWSFQSATLWRRRR